jgi:catechol 2,3-dioxygenase-like lactoylglutathione lyase family enzyme
MALLYFDHVNVRTANLAGMTEFYCNVLGLRSGPRPAFAFGGAWLYCGERPVVHLVEVDEAPSPSGALRLEHFAFAADDFDGFVATLTEASVEHRVSKLTGTETRQVNLRDPDGNRVHFDFPTHLAK